MLSKWCKNKHGASKIIDTFETYQWCIIKIGLLVWKLPGVGGLDRIIFGLLPILVYGLRVLLYVRVKLILHE
jgi:hypothetical protein